MSVRFTPLRMRNDPAVAMMKKHTNASTRLLNGDKKGGLCTGPATSKFGELMSLRSVQFLTIAVTLQDPYSRPAILNPFGAARSEVVRKGCGYVYGV